MTRILTLQSSSLGHIGYNPETEDLFVMFRQSGKWVVYRGVPADVFVAILTDTVSHGRAFDAKIRKGNFPFEYIEQSEHELHV